MNQAPLVFLSTFFALSAGWLGLVVAPQLQIGGQPQVVIEETGQIYPSKPSGMARQGEQVYRANGCFYCHTQQVRPAAIDRAADGHPKPARLKGIGGDFERHWGARSGPVQSVAQDYLFAEPAMLGQQRIGPDLTNLGLRQTNSVWLFQHLYNPRSLAKGSVMPPYQFLFEKRKLKPGQIPSSKALPEDPQLPGYEIIPTADAQVLVAYLLSLHSETILFEAPAAEYVKPATKATNAPPAVIPAAKAPAK
jgi:cytochrome c oxidase cbb3-type subunit 2